MGTRHIRTYPVCDVPLAQPSARWVSIKCRRLKTRHRKLKPPFRADNANLSPKLDITHARSMNMRAYQESRCDACNCAEQMCLPGNARLTRKNAPNDRAIEQPYQNRGAKRYRRSVDKASRDQKTEPPEYQSGCADMDSRTPKKPDQRAPQADHDKVHGHQGSSYGCGQQCAQQKQRGCIRHQMLETAMQERHADHTVKPAELPRYEPEPGVESVAGRPIDSLDYPQHGDEAD